jgi:hypothetical protein
MVLLLHNGAWLAAAAAAAVRVLSVPLEEIVTPGLSMRVAGEGMPLPSGGGKVRGNAVKQDVWHG